MARLDHANRTLLRESITRPPLPPAFCVECGTVPHWRYREAMRWHCVACAPCPDPDDARFTWHEERAELALGDAQASGCDP